MLRTLVINLEQSENRRRAIESRLGELGIPFQFVRAVDGESMTSAQASAYSPRAAFSQIGREMHRNEIGCILSHISIWRDIVANGDDEVLVIEDDMILESDFSDLIRSREWIPPDADIVNLSWDMANPIDLRPISSTRFLCRFDKEVMRTGSYIIRRKAAESLLSNAFPIRMPVDSLMGDEKNVGTIYGVTPRPVSWDEALPTVTWTDTTMDSFAGASRKSVKGLIFRALNKLSAR